MTKIKIIFSLAIITLLCILSVGALKKTEVDKVNVFNKIEEIYKGSITDYQLSDAKTYTCTLETPKNRTIILRMDDIAVWSNIDSMKKLVGEVTTRGYGISLGVIPKGVEDNVQLVKWLRNINTNPNIELSQHGYKHDNEEFVNLNYQDAKTKIELGKEIMIRMFGEAPMNFIPPYNVESQETITALKDEGFVTYSGENGEYEVTPNFVMAGYTATTYKYDRDVFVNSDEVLKNCEDSLDKSGICVIMMHPQDFTENGKINAEKYAEFIKTLDGLKNLNANVVNFRQAFCKEY